MCLLVLNCPLLPSLFEEGSIRIGGKVNDLLTIY